MMVVVELLVFLVEMSDGNDDGGGNDGSGGAAGVSGGNE